MERMVSDTSGVVLDIDPKVSKEKLGRGKA
jgi:hypothetical protein